LGKFSILSVFALSTAQKITQILRLSYPTAGSWYNQIKFSIKYMRFAFFRHILLPPAAIRALFPLAFVILVCGILNVYAAPGSLDTTFNGTGKQQTAFPGAATSSAVGIQSTGKIVVVGSVDVSGVSNFALARYNTDGTLDTTFGSGGLVITPVLNGGVGVAILIEPVTDKIIAAGSAVPVASPTDSDFALVRYNADGSLDGTFGTGGISTTSVSSVFDSLNAVAFQGSKIIAAGVAAGATNDDFAVVRFNSNGSVDTTFGPVGANGKVITPVGTGNDAASGVAVQSDSKIVVVGSADTAMATPINFAVVRYNSDGTTDSGFGTGGKVITSLQSNDDEAFDVAIQSDSRIVVAGATCIAAGCDFGLVRYNTDGTLDASFGSGGKVITPVRSGNDIANAVVIAPDGKIVAAGNSEASPGNNDFALFRYTSSGAPDFSFGSSGAAFVDFGGTDDFARGMVLDSSARILVTGQADPSGQFSIARLMGGSITTAATVEITGRVVTATGRGIRNAIVTMTDSFGNAKIVRTNMFGFFRFDDVRVGNNVIMTVSAKAYSFDQPMMVLNVQDTISDLQFVATQ